MPKALARARKLAGKRGLVVACGSIFLMAEVRARVLTSWVISRKQQLGQVAAAP